MIQITYVIATSNRGKAHEIEKILRSSMNFPHAVKSLSDFPGPISEPEETGTTYLENARLKASYYFQALELEPGYYEVVADDSGLECDELQGYPGLISARIAETDQKRRDALLDRLRERLGQKESYPARFVCCAVSFNGFEFKETRGECLGVIRAEERGTHGFGYDPIFYLPDGRTMAEIPSNEKNRISHRGLAFQQLLGTFEGFQSP